ncbi:hypothetical protein [Burkholderia cenocepacia]|uniref:hypothetical protein n=1 Tax=Burkholderia cenocepacia TaxID=95486 RepID=UPI000F5A6D2A|nr:hypothetical protein [Burkholderia cenocepacia]MBR8507724.1 hypothetical protein [Burkholderia cenocepacia]
MERLVPCFRILVFAVGYSNALRNVLYTASATRQRDAWLKEGVRVYAGCRFCLAARVEQLSTSARLARVGPPPRTAATSLCDSRCRKRSQLSKRSTPRTWVTNTSDVRVNGNGYTIHAVSAAALIGLSIRKAVADVELKETSQPPAGAVPMLAFKTEYGRLAVFVRVSGRSPAPFGAIVTNTAGKDCGVIGRAARLLAHGRDEGRAEGAVAEGLRQGGVQPSYSRPMRERAEGYQPLPSLELPCVVNRAAMMGRLL